MSNRFKITFGWFFCFRFRKYRVFGCLWTVHRCDRTRILQPQQSWKAFIYQLVHRYFDALCIDLSRCLRAVTARCCYCWHIFHVRLLLSPIHHNNTSVLNRFINEFASCSTVHVRLVEWRHFRLIYRSPANPKIRTTTGSTCALCIFPRVHQRPRCVATSTRSKTQRLEFGYCNGKYQIQSITMM